MTVVAFGALLSALIVLGALLMFVSHQHANAERGWADERQRLTHLVVSRHSGDYAALRRADRKQPADATQEIPVEEPQIGLGG